MKTSTCMRFLQSSLAVAAITLTLARCAQAQTETVLHSFNGTNGNGPYPTLIVDSKGNLYGTTVNGGILHACESQGCGVVFKMVKTTGGEWKEVVLHSFTGGRYGFFPKGAVVQAPDGSLYGTTTFGGVANACQGPGCGVVFKLTPTPSGPWKETIVHSFTGGADGGVPQGRLVLDAAGNLYGTTLYGGNTGDCPDSTIPGCGVVYQLSRQASGSWNETVLYAFTGGNDGGLPLAGVTLDAAGNVYGAASFYGAAQAGTIFELSPSSSGWTEKTIHSFAAQPDGAYPESDLTFDAAGNLYGTTYNGGNGGGIGSGTIFELTPTSSGPWTETILFNFDGSETGGEPLSGIVFDASGTLYGTTSFSNPRPNNHGLAYELIPGAGGVWTESVLHYFTSSGDGLYPYGGLVFDKTGNLYGTTNFGGTANDGAVFEITP